MSEIEAESTTPPPVAAASPPPVTAAPTGPIDLTTFVSHFTTSLTRYELYPADQPSCYVVGFVSTYNQDAKRTFYKDTQIPLADAAGLAESDIINAGWLAVKDGVSAWAQSVISSPKTHFTPTTL